MSEGEVLDLARGEFPIDLGHGIRLREVPEGYELRHLCLTGGPESPQRRKAWIAPSVCIGAGHHQLVTREPLTLRPSLKCPSCGLHGFVTAGKWVPQ